MSSIIEGYNYDIFISYRQKDNKHDAWVTKFVENLKGELEATFKEDVSVYFDENPHDRLQETHNVDKSLEGKLKCLIFIPILSQTYCDPNSYAWQYELLAFLKMVENDPFGKDVKLRGGNIASRILPIRIHDLEQEDIKLFEKETGSVLRAMDFVFKTSAGVNRPLKINEDHPQDNLNKTFYADQINKVAHAIKEIIHGMKAESARVVKEKTSHREPLKEVKKDEGTGLKVTEKPSKFSKRNQLTGGIILAGLLVIAAILAYPKIFKRDTLERLRSSGQRISVAVMPFQNMTIDTTWNVWQDGIQNELITSLTNCEELKVRQTESINGLIQSKGYASYSSITPSVARIISQKLDADVFIYGSIKQAGKTIRINAQLTDSKTEEVFKSFQVEGIADDILYIIDKLTDELKDFLIISKLEKQVTPENKRLISTYSPEAYRYCMYGDAAFYKRDNLLTALNWYSKAISIDSNFYYVIRRISQTYRILDLYDQARIWCLKAYEKKDQMPKGLQLKTYRLYAAFFETPYDEIKYLKQLLDFDDQDPGTYSNLGSNYSELYQYDKAITEYKKAQEVFKKWGIKPTSYAFYTGLCDAYHQTGQYRKEKKLYRKAEQDYPDHPEIIRRQAILSLTEGDTLISNELIKKYISLSKERALSGASILRNLAQIYSNADIPHKAEEYYRQALSLEPEIPDRLNDLAYYLIDNERNVNEGLELINKALVSGTENYKYLHTKGWGLYKQNKYEEALEMLEKGWNLRLIYDHPLFLHLEAAKKSVAGQKI